MALTDDLSSALKEAMKAKDKPKLDAIRQVQTEIAKKKSEKGEEATDELVLGVISSYVKKMTKAVEEYQSLGDRGTEMAVKIQFEIDFFEGVKSVARLNKVCHIQMECCLTLPKNLFCSARG